MSLDFEAEYQHVHDLCGGGVELIHGLRKNMEEQMEKVNNASSLYDITSNEEEFGFMQEQVIVSRKTVSGTHKFLTSDYSPALKMLQDMLIKYSSMLQERLKNEMVNYIISDIRKQGASSDDISQMQTQVKSQQQMAQLVAELKKLQQQMLEWEQAIEDLKQLAAETADRNIQLEKDISEAGKVPPPKLDDKKEETNDESNETDDEEGNKDNPDDQEESDEKIEEERTEQEAPKEETEAERLEREEEERLRKENEEKEREEERLRKEKEEKEREEERLRKEKEEKERLEKIRLEKLEKERLEEEERIKKDPRNWKNVIMYTLNEDEDWLGHGMACVVRAPEDVPLQMEDLVCTLVDVSTNRYRLDENEELVSNMINLRPNNANQKEFESDIWLALPYSQARHRETKIRIQIPSAEGDTSISSWQDATTQETTVHGQELSIKFVQTPLRHLPADGLNITVVTRLKRDVHSFNNKGGKFVSSVDHRVYVQVPKNAFRLTVDVSLQVNPVDTAALAELKGRYDGCESVIGCSPIVCLNSSHNPQLPLTISLTNPFGGKHKRPAIESGGTKSADKIRKNIDFPRINTGGESNNSSAGDGDFVWLLTREANGRWRLRMEIVLDFQKDSILFQMEELAERYLLVRTSSLLEASVLSNIVTNLEKSLKERLATIVVRQDVDDNAMIHIEVCKSDNANKVIQDLTRNKYTDGPATQVVCLREGDLIEVTFSPSGNIRFEDSKSRSFIFNSNLASSRTSAVITEKDIYAQNASETYKGHIEFGLVERNYDPSPKFLPKMKRQNIDKKFISDMLISLPKLPKEVNRNNRIRFPILNSAPLTEEYFDHLAEELAQEWVIIADRLKISKAAIQRIVTTYAEFSKSSAMEKSIKHMLTDWFKTSTKSDHKAEDLRMALMEAGRNDLSDELANKIKERRYEIEKKTEEEDIEKLCKAFCNSQVALKSWKKVAKALGLNENDILAIQGAQEEQGTTEIVRGMLRKWKENYGKEASKESLILSLQNLKLTEAAGKVSLVR